MILCKGGANEPYDMRLPGKAGGAVAGLLAGLVRATRLKRQVMRLRREHALRHPKDARSADVA